MNPPTLLETTRGRLQKIIEEAGLLDAEVSVLAKPLTAEEAIGTPGRRDYPIVVGKERVIEAQVLGAKGHAFTDAPKEFVGTLRDVLQCPLGSSSGRAVYVATLNAVLGHLGRAKGTVHCKDEDPEQCAREIADQLLAVHGRVKVGLIGLNPAIAERLVAVFGADGVLIADLSAANIGAERFGVEIWDGRERAAELIQAADVVVLTGTTLVNGTFDELREQLEAAQTPSLVYGVTAAGVCALMGVERICPCGRDA